ncbi:MAG: sugar phosphate isomerase/epimerase family protein [Armatimonadota bacterium]|nr:sugar phosphate isomerase/epimerase family protein [Armatimonadota bacterium]
MGNVIACNIASYGRYREGAFAHMRSLGIENVEIPVPAPEAVAGVLQELGQHGLKVTSVLGRFDLKNPDCVETLKPQAETARRLGAQVIFLSVKAGDLPLETAYNLLRAAGDVAAAQGLAIAIETHPDLAHNGTVALATVQGVSHPSVGINFDTGNIYYYNEGTDAVTELRKIARHVKSVHLKDSRGGFKTFDFPPLGQGVVDYPEVFRVLNAHGFHGPFTMELEGSAGVTLSQAQQYAMVADSFAYLKRIGVV